MRGVQKGLAISHRHTGRRESVAWDREGGTRDISFHTIDFNRPRQ